MGHLICSLDELVTQVRLVRAGGLPKMSALDQENQMPRPKKLTKDPRNFINVAVSKETRAGLHLLKEAMRVPGQAEVIERLVTIGVAIHLATANR